MNKTPLFLVLVLLFQSTWVEQSESAIQYSLGGSNWQVENGQYQCGATVPGDIFTDLLACQVLTEDPYFRYNDVNYRWVALADWSYSTRVAVPQQLAAMEAVVLVFEGVDTVAQISWNHQPLGFVNNMFRKYSFPLAKELLGAGSANATGTLQVDFLSAEAYATAQMQQYPYFLPASDNLTQQSGEPYRNYMRKEQCSFSWDWGPAFLPQGVWLPTYLLGFNAVALKDLSIRVLPLDPSLASSATDQFDIRITAFLYAAPSGGQGTFHFYLNGTLLTSKTFSVPAASPVLGGHQPQLREIPLEFHVYVDGVQLWWPRGYGGQPLYNLTVQMDVDSDGSSTSVSRQVGFRTVELIYHSYKEQVGTSMYFQINGVPIFAKGANLIPLNSFESQVTAANLTQIIQDAYDANMNIVRVWGGGIYQHDQLYETADRLGIMIWQEFMFATSMAPRDAEFLENVSEEVRHQVRRLAFHPSIVLWSGNNENESALGWFQQTLDNRDLYVIDYAQLYYNTILTTLRQEDQSRPFRPSSPTNGLLTTSPPFVGVWGNPSNGSIGDLHYYNYDALCIDVSSFPQSRFVSEYGWQSFPSLQTWKPVTLPQDWAPFSPLMNHRQHHFEGTQQIEAMMSQMFAMPVVDNGQGEQGFSAWIYLSQATQSDCIRAQSEHYRRSRDLPANTMGAIYWQLNDIWQGPTWASLEFGGRWKMLHYAAAEFFAPVATSIFEQADIFNLWVVSDLQTSVAGSVALQVFSWQQNAQLWATTVNFTLNALSGSVVYTRPTSELMKAAGCQARTDCVALATATLASGETLPESKFFFSWLQGGLANVTLPDVNLTISNLVQSNSQLIQFQLSSSALAPYVFLSTSVPGRFSRNGFFMTANQTVSLSFIAQQDTSVAQLQQDLTVVSVQSAYQSLRATPVSPISLS